MLYRLVKPILFKLDPEDAHHLSLKIASLSPMLGKLSGLQDEPRLQLKVGSIDWKFPVGLAAGLDKNAEALNYFDAQGFGAIETGTVTLKPQGGNPRPRIFRYPAEESLRNAMGFPNEGVQNILPRLGRYDGDAPIGVNFGKNKDTSTEESIEELSLLFQLLRDAADYLVINVSSPNTPGLRALQERSYLSELFQELKAHRAGKDLFLKIAPDLDPQKVEELASLVADFQLTGIIATNTTIIPEKGPGGFSGKLLAKKARSVQNWLLQKNPSFEIIGVGGISGIKDILEFWKMGGKAVQIYTAYVYHGPELLQRMQLDLLAFARFQSLGLEAFMKLPLAEKKERISAFEANQRTPLAARSVRYIR
jgi:dihydroorotate dehydrogenase